MATLILILIAVAAAAALYLWLVGWQGSVTGSISKPGVNQGSFTIGGSTSVYPFDQLAVTQYEQNNTGVTIDNTPGGTGAGMLAVCEGQIDVGASSSLQTPASLIASDSCPAADASTITITTVAYDAVDLITSTSAGGPTLLGTDPLLSMNATVLLAIYVDDSAGTPTLTVGTGVQTWLGPLWAPGTGVQWDEVPTTAGCGVGATTLAAALTTGGVSATGCTKVDSTHEIDTVSRSDASGTTQAFESRMLGATSNTKGAQPLASLAFTGCGGNNLLSDCGINTTKTANGNPAVITTVAGDVNAIGYASDGLVRAAGSGVTYVDFAATTQTCASLTSYPSSQVSACGVIPSLGATGTIAAGITSSTSVANYAGWRPFEYVTLAPPTGVVASYMQFVLQPGNNIALASEAAEVSIYSI